jgi:hypothetical protein
MYKKQETTQEPLSRIGLCFTYEQLNILTNFQRLFIQLTVLMRAAITGWIFQNPNFNAIAQNLMSIPKDFGDALQVFYGPEVASHFSNLLTNFISNIFTILEGYSTNNQELINQSVQKWYSDANELSKYLDSVNIFWTEPQWENLLYQYIQSNFAMITSLYTGDYDREQEGFNTTFNLAIIMGNFMAQGLIARELQRQVVNPSVPATPQTQRT